MTGRGRGRGRGLQAAKPGVPGGRGSGLQTQSPAATPAAPTETPAVSTETPAPASASLGRGRVRSSAQSSASPSASPSLSLGRGRALLAEKRSASSVPPPGLGEPSPVPALDSGKPIEKSESPEEPVSRSESAEGAVSRSECSEGSVKRSESSGSTGISLESMLMALPEIPRYKRPARGSEGREIALQSNLFKVALKGGTWYKYDVEILTKENEKQELVGASEAKLKDKIQSRHLNRVVIDELFRRHTAVFGDHWPAYDGRKTLICAKKFFHDHMFTLSLEKNERGGNKHFAVNLRFIMEVDVTQVQAFYNQQQCPLSLEVIQAGNIIIDSALGRAFVAVNRSYYASTRSPMTNPSLTGGKELRSGVYTSLRFTEWGPLLLVDKSNTAFYKGGDLIQYIGDFLNDKERRFLRNGFRREQLLLLSRDLKRLTVKLKHSQRGRCVRINGLSEYPASQIEFTRGENEKTTVAKYFNERYADYVGTLKYPNLPCVIVVRGAKTDYYPLEVCELKQDQPYRRKLNPMQTAMMIRNCQEKPSDRIAKSIENVKTVKETGRHVLRQHGVEIDEKPVQTVGRQIDPPHVLVKGDKISVVNGVWKQQYFHEGAELSQWCVVDCADVGLLANRLADLIYTVARKMQLTNVAKAIKVIPGSTMNLHDIFKTLCKMHTDKKKPMLAVFILGTSPVMYSQIKLLSEIKRDFGPIITQCVKGENITNSKKFSEMFVSNVMKKINVKLGGINNVIHKSSMPTRFSAKPFIVIGADVNHAAPGDFLTPSIAAVVGSIDYVPSKYYTEIRVQTNENNNRIEYIKDLKDIAVELLKAHRRSTSVIPEHIYYIRDGVSEGQFEAVRRFEINALRQACKSLASDYQPSMTVLIAQKRHHVRFNVLDPRQAAGKAGNVPPGTYIDRDVVHPEMFDLYMYTHQGLLGTSRPTHYHLIHSDDKSIGTDDITKIINHLCHVYARSSSAVSIPAPIYYAHHAAARAKEHIKGSMSLSGIDVQSVSSGGDNTTLDTAQFKASCIVHEEFRNVLYYA